jgi:hypothetical protein
VKELKHEATTETTKADEEVVAGELAAAYAERVRGARGGVGRKEVERVGEAAVSGKGPVGGAGSDGEERRRAGGGAKLEEVGQRGRRLRREAVGDVNGPGVGGGARGRGERKQGRLHGLS